MGGRRRHRTVTVTWSGAINPTANDIVPDEDKVLYLTGAAYVTVQLVTPTVAAGAATFDLHTIGSNHADAGYTTAHFQTNVITAQAKAVTGSPAVITQGPHYIKLRLDLNAAVLAEGEDVVAYVWIDYVE